MQFADMTSFHVEKRELTQAELDAVHAAVEQLNKLTGKLFRPVRLMFNRYIVCEFRTVLFARVSTSRRPPKGSWVAIAGGVEDRLLLPIERPEDFDELCEILQLKSKLEQQKLLEFLAPPADSLQR